MINIANLKIEWVKSGAVQSVTFEDFLASRAEAAEARAARAELQSFSTSASKTIDTLAAQVEQLTRERDTGRYEATMEASRAVYDVAQVYREAGDTQEYSALIQAFNKIVTSEAANP